MKAQVLGNIGVSKSISNDDYVKRSLNDPTYLGEVEPIGLPDNNEAITQLRSFAEFHGFKRRSCSFYTDQAFLPLFGSVGWHSDEGLGLLLCWVIKVKDLDGFCCYDKSCALLTKHGSLELLPGSVFIFNANIGHAWLSNSKVLLAQMSVSKKRK